MSSKFEDCFLKNKSSLVFAAELQESLYAHRHPSTPSICSNLSLHTQA